MHHDCFEVEESESTPAADGRDLIPCGLLRVAYYGVDVSGIMFLVGQKLVQAETYAANDCQYE